MECEFCNYKFNIEPDRLVYEDEEYIAFLSREPLVKGHCIITSKEHVEFISGVPEFERFFKLVGFVSQAIKDAVSANHIRLETRYGNDNHIIKHAHMHLVPVNGHEASDVEEKILQNLRKSGWYATLNRR